MFALIDFAPVGFLGTFAFFSVSFCFAGARCFQVWLVTEALRKALEFL